MLACRPCDDARRIRAGQPRRRSVSKCARLNRGLIKILDPKDRIIRVVPRLLSANGFHGIDPGSLMRGNQCSQYCYGDGYQCRACIADQVKVTELVELRPQ